MFANSFSEFWRVKTLPIFNEVSTVSQVSFYTILRTRGAALVLDEVALGHARGLGLVLAQQIVIVALFARTLTGWEGFVSQNKFG